MESTHQNKKQNITDSELRRIKLELKEIQLKIRKAEKEAKLALERRFSQLHTKREALEGNLKEWKHAGGAALKDLKKGFQVSWRDLKKSVQQATARF